MSKGEQQVAFLVRMLKEELYKLSPDDIEILASNGATLREEFPVFCFSLAHPFVLLNKRNVSQCRSVDGASLLDRLGGLKGNRQFRNDFLVEDSPDLCGDISPFDVQTQELRIAMSTEQVFRHAGEKAIVFNPLQFFAMVFVEEKGLSCLMPDRTNVVFVRCPKYRMQDRNTEQKIVAVDCFCREEGSWYYESRDIWNCYGWEPGIRLITLAT